LQQTAGQKIVKDAAMKGDVVIAQGNTIKEISADQANQTKTPLILDYRYARPAFFGEPILTVKTPLVVNSGVGTLTINGWNVNNKEGITAVAATQPGAHVSPDLKQFPSPKGPIILKDPIYPGCIYTWGDATKGGQMIPESDDVYKGIFRIAQIIQKYTDEEKKGKWTITSWYRTRAYNEGLKRRGYKAADDSRHLYGDGVDFTFDGFGAFHDKMAKWWTGGVARGKGFCHLDDRPSRSLANRWTYPY
jgi:hypothetical protein